MRYDDSINNEYKDQIFKTARKDYNAGYYQKALAGCEQVIQIDKDFAGAYHGKGLALIGLSHNEEAIKAFQQAIKLAPERPKIYIDLAQFLYKLGRFEESGAVYRCAIQLKPKYISVYTAQAQRLINRGKALYRNKHFKEAIRTFQQLIDFRPEQQPKIHIDLAQSLYKHEHFEEAEIAYRQAIQLKPEYITTYTIQTQHLIDQGKTLYDTERFEDAGEVFRNAIQFNPDSNTLYANLTQSLLDKGQALFESEHFEDAILAYQQVIQFNASCHQIYKKQARTLMDDISLLYQQKNSEKARIIYHNLFQFDPDSATTYISDLVSQGQAYYDLKDYEEALALFEEIISLDPNNKAAYRGKGQALGKLKRHAEARTAFKAASRFALNSTKTYVTDLASQAQTCYDLEDYEEALVFFDEIISFDPSNETAYRGKGQTLDKLKRHTEARTAFKAASRFALNNTKTYVTDLAFQAQTCYDLEDYEEALTLFEEFISLDPSNEAAYKAKGRTLDKLKRHTEARTAFRIASQLTISKPPTKHNEEWMYKEKIRYE